MSSHQEFLGCRLGNEGLFSIPYAYLTDIFQTTSGPFAWSPNYINNAAGGPPIGHVLLVIRFCFIFEFFLLGRLQMPVHHQRIHLALSGCRNARKPPRPMLCHSLTALSLLLTTKLNCIARKSLAPWRDLANVGTWPAPLRVRSPTERSCTRNLQRALPALLVRAQFIRAENFTVFFRHENFVAGRTPIRKRILARVVSAGEVSLSPATNHRLDDFPIGSPSLAFVSRITIAPNPAASFPAFAFFASLGLYLIVSTTRNCALPLIIRANASSRLLSGNFSIIARTPDCDVSVLPPSPLLIHWPSLNLPGPWHATDTFHRLKRCTPQPAISRPLPTRRSTPSSH